MSGGEHMARATITQTFDAEGNVRTFTLTTECDVLDTPETLDQAVSKAAVLWRVSQTEVE